MAVFAISDLHLALSVDKPMDVFGARWADYMARLKASWEEAVGEDDTVVIPGDISWATYLEQAVEDFTFIDRLPGKKIISKGNHDYWWTTMSKLDKFLNNNNLTTIRFMQNNSYAFEGWTLCGTRGWKCPGDSDFTEEDQKIYKRELQRLELSLGSFEKGHCGQILLALHYPPFNARGKPSGFTELIDRFNVKLCIYGHLHGEGHRNAVEGRVHNTEYRLVAADYIRFMPVLLSQAGSEVK